MTMMMLMMMTPYSSRPANRHPWIHHLLVRNQSISLVRPDVSDISCAISSYGKKCSYGSSARYDNNSSHGNNTSRGSNSSHGNKRSSDARSHIYGARTFVTPFSLAPPYISRIYLGVFHIAAWYWTLSCPVTENHAVNKTLPPCNNRTATVGGGAH